MTVQSLRIPANIGPQAAEEKERQGFLSVLSIRPFRYLLLSNGLSFMFPQLSAMVIAWLVLDMTGSGMWVGIVNGLPSLSVIIFSLYGGVLADRVNATSLLVWLRGLLALSFFLLGGLVTTGVISVWQLMAIVFVTTGMQAIDVPVGRNVIFDVVGKDRMLSAGALTDLAKTMGNIIMPTVLGMVMANVGLDVAVYALGVVYAIAVAMLFLKGSASRKASAEKLAVGNKSVLLDLAEGFRYVRQNRKITWIVVLAFSMPLAGVFFGMQPAYARDVLNIGAEGLGLLVAAFWIGSAVSMGFQTIHGNIGKKGPLIAVTGVLFGAGAVAFAFAPGIQIALASVFFMGIVGPLWMNLLTTLMQTDVDEEVRGRVNGIFSLGLRTMSFGWFLGGVLASALGIVATLVIAGGLFAAINVAVFVHSKDFRSID